MRLTLQLVGFADLSTEQSQMDVEVAGEGCTFADLLETLKRSDAAVTNTLFRADAEQLDASVTVLHNNKRISGNLEYPLVDGDGLSFVRILAGG